MAEKKNLLKPLLCVCLKRKREVKQTKNKNGGQ